MQKNAKKAARVCLYKNCDRPSISSHLLQKRGIIDSISEQKHVVEISLHAFKQDYFKFKTVGIGEALCYPGFCNQHDTDLFKEIESGVLKYDDYRTHLLLSYRASMIEKRKKEINIDWHNRILNSKLLSSNLDTHFKNEQEESIRGEKQGIKDEEYYEGYFLSNIENDTLRDFEFLYFELSRIEICSSAVFTYETTEELAFLNVFQRQKLDEPLTNIYFHFLPYNEKSIVIFGCLKANTKKCWKYISEFYKKDEAQTLKKISDLFICQVENWVCSPTFYKINCKNRETEINRLVRLSMKHPNERRSLDFNLFAISK